MRDSSMWRSSDQEALGLDRSFLQQQQQQQTPRNSHDTLYHRQHQTSQPQLSEQHPGEFMRAQTAGQANNNIAHGLPQALLAEAGHAADLPNMQLDLDSVTLSAALGLGGDNALTQFQRNLSDQNGQSSSDLSAILAASLGLPGQTSLGTLLGNEGLTGSLGATGMFNLPQLLPQNSLISSKDSQSLSGVPKRGSTRTQLKPSVEIEEHAESDEHSEGDEGSAGTKRKGPMTEEDKKRRRQEINRQSARRIRERRSHEMERLKQQNALLHHQLGQLLKYASSLAREKNVLVQRTMELTERWNQAAAENIELRIKAAPPANNPGSAAVGTYRHNQTQSDSPQPPQQALPGQQASGDNGPGFAH
ncbi:TPA: hypothetical protein ACH3X3_013834 [Trebouxia sp. C0006]